MNYQVMYSTQDGWENVYPDGYGMHSDPDNHNGANFQNVLDGEAHIRQGQSAVRVVENDEGYSIIAYPEAGMPNSSPVADFDTPEEAENYLIEHYAESDCRFDDDYQCAGCWSPETGDVDVWFTAIEETGAIAARCGNALENVRVFDADEYFTYYDELTIARATGLVSTTPFSYLRLALLANSGGDDVLVDGDCTVLEAHEAIRENPGGNGWSYFAIPAEQLVLYRATCAVVDSF